MRQSREDQIKELKATIAQAEMCQAFTDTCQQWNLDQRRIDALNVQLKELQK